MADIIEPLNHRPQIRWKKPVILLALVLFGLYASTHMVAAGDTWVALACGRHFANHGVDTVEPFSFNSHPPGPTDEQLAGWPEWTHRLIRFWHPTGWINQNWLTHLTFYKLVTGFGSEQEPHYNALVYWKFALFVATIFVVYALGKVLGAGDFLSMLAACFAMVAGRSFYDIRPACYSNLLVPLFILLLALSCYRHYKYIWLMVPLIVFWANVHGGYIYAYIMMTPFVAVHILLNLPRRWTIALGLSGLWMVLYLLFYKFHQNSYYFELAKTLNLSFDRIGFVNGFFWTGIVLSVVSLTLAALRRIPSGLFYSFHVVATLVYPVGLLAAMTLNVPSYVSPAYLKLLKHSMTVGRLGFVLVLLLGTVIVILLAIRKERFVRIPNKTIAHILGAGVVSFLAMIVFNPYHLTNLTHTFEISISEHAASWRTVNEWRPAFDWMDPARETPNPVGDEEGFAVMLIAAVVLLAVWGGLHFCKPALRPIRKGPRQAEAVPAADAGWPKIDLAILLIAALTMIMAFQSRRFIALASPSASPMIALLAAHIWQMATALRNWKKTRHLEPSAFPVQWHKPVWLATAGVVVVLGVYWDRTFYRVYIAPWPRDDIRDSVFMRMTDSHQKPFEVCEFINANKLYGRIFNYWTEGGALAFGQEPDPITGKTPLQHFMDGRAQAAFDHATFKLWQHIFAGGPVAEKIMRSGRTPTTAEEYRQIGQWLDKVLKNCDVWVSLMPRSQIDSTFMRSLLSTSNWKTVFVDEMQHLIVDTDSKQGQELVNAVLDGTAVFPNAFSKNLTLVRLTFETNDSRHVMNVFDYAKAAFQERPYPSAMIALAQIGRSAAFRDQVEQTMRDFLGTFQTRRGELARQSGYLHRLGSALVASRYLAAFNPPDKDELLQFAKALQEESQDISKRFIW